MTFKYTSLHHGWYAAKMTDFWPFLEQKVIFHRLEFLIPKSFFANLAKGAAICIVQFHICDFKLWGLQSAVLKSFLVFLGPGTARDNICCAYTVISDPARLAEHLQRTCESEPKKKRRVVGCRVVHPVCSAVGEGWATSGRGAHPRDRVF